MKFWSVFFLVVSVLIVTTMMLPTVFGLQSFNQWGGFYVDAWCHVDVYDGDPLAQGATPRHEYIRAGDGPQHNPETCTVWAKTRCGRTSAEGWTITWARPYFKHKYILGDGNACALPPPAHAWFTFPD